VTTWRFTCAMPALRGAKQRIGTSSLRPRLLTASPLHLVTLSKTSSGAFFKKQMSDPDFPEALRSFIRDNIPDVDAAELLLLLARNRERRFDLHGVLAELTWTAVTEPVARKHLTLLQERGLVVSQASNYQYSPSTPQLDAAVHALMRVYNERPVTMVRMIYTLRDEKIRSFADAFRFKK
jgi:hypothetical protein